MIALTFHRKEVTAMKKAYNKPTVRKVDVRAAKVT